MTQNDLFDHPVFLPQGLAYQPDFVSEEEAAHLLSGISELPFRQAQYKAYTANRRVVRFGDGGYLDKRVSEFDEQNAGENPRRPFPAFLDRLKEKSAQWARVKAPDFEHALVSEYQPGVPIGWHRDAPHFEIVVGITLASAARMRFKPFGGSGKKDIFSIDLAPRSAYIMRGPIRWNWQHSIPPHKALRYSITLRTVAK